MKEFVLRDRDFYLEQLIDKQDNGMIKIITGLRGCGKTCLLRLYERYLKLNAGEKDVIIRINTESLDIPRMTGPEMFRFIEGQTTKEGRTYIMLDEIQHIPDWEDLVNLLEKDPTYDIYLASSHAGVVTGQLNAVRDKAYQEIRLLPLSLVEFIYYHSFSVMNDTADVMDRKYQGTNGQIYTLMEVYELYTRYGGLPLLVDTGLDEDKGKIVLEGSYSTTIIRDILEIEVEKGQRTITDAVLLRGIVTLLADSLGDNVSATSIARNLDDAAVAGSRSKKPATRTVETYMQALQKAFLYYPTIRYDIRADKFLKTLGKEYIIDTGIHHYLLGSGKDNAAALLENSIYFELIRRNFEVYNGKYDSSEITFVAVRGIEKYYIQVDLRLDDHRKSKSLSPLRKIRDSYPKILIVFDQPTTRTADGILIINALEYLMGAEMMR